jgi:hypothetical protein
LLSGRLAAADRFAGRFHEEKATYFVETLPYITVSLEHDPEKWIPVFRKIMLKR